MTYPETTKRDFPEAIACRELSDAINNMGFKKDRFLDEFDRTHRYLQGEIFELCLKIIQHCAEDTYGTDERNEWCKRIAKDIVSKAEIFN